MDTARIESLLTDSARLRRLAYSLVSGGEADDLVQDTLVVAATTEGERSPAWLRGVMRNLARMRFRERARRERREQAVALPDAATPVDEVQRMEIQRAVCDEVLALPDAYRQVIVMHHLEGLTLAAIAKRLGIAEGTVRWRHKEALERLRIALENRSKGDRRTWLAALAPVRPPASASGSAAFTLAAAAAILVIAGVVLAVTLSSSGTPGGGAPDSPVAQGAPLPGNNAGSGARTSAPAIPQLPADGSATGKRDRLTGQLPPPPGAYELTVVTSDLVAVALGGGKSSVFSPGVSTRAPRARRAIAGRVVDSKGRGLAGAVVVAGDRLTTQWAQLIGEAGATTDATGTFQLDAAAIELRVIALHGTGWSAVTTVGKDQREVTIAMPRPGVLRGRVQYSGAPVPATLSLVPRGYAKQVMFDIESRPDGTYEFPMLAPGTYDLAAWPTRDIGGGADKREPVAVTVAEGAATVRDFDLREAVLLVVSAAPPPARAPFMVEAFLVKGHHAIADHAALSALVKTLPANEHDRLLHGGRDAPLPLQFHDRAPGAYTICVELSFRDASDKPFRCERVDVRGERATREITVAF